MRRTALAGAWRRRWVGGLVLAGASALGARGAAAEETWAERLGYPADRPVLILHADDIGMCFEANQAAAQGFAAGGLRSASAMVPCPWFEDVWVWYAQHPDADLGLHLTLTSEWRTYRWGPVAPRAEVPGLCDPQGFLWRSVREVCESASAAEVERELRAQIERAIARGPRPGHLDTHMGTVYARIDYARAYLGLAVEYRIPAMVIEPTPAVVAHFRARGYPLDDDAVKVLREVPLPKLDALLSLPDQEDYEAARAQLLATIAALPRPGITQVILHPATESDALRRIVPEPRWRQRVYDARLLVDPEVRAAITRAGVVETDWKEVMRRFEARARREAANSEGPQREPGADDESGAPTPPPSQPRGR